MLIYIIYVCPILARSYTHRFPPAHATFNIRSDVPIPPLDARRDVPLKIGRHYTRHIVIRIIRQIIYI